jgi:hypothetical protein
MRGKLQAVTSLLTIGPWQPNDSIVLISGARSGGTRLHVDTFNIDLQQVRKSWRCNPQEGQEEMCTCGREHLAFHGLKSTTPNFVNNLINTIFNSRMICPTTMVTSQCIAETQHWHQLDKMLDG